MWPKGLIGVHAWGGDSARCRLNHDSPPDQESIECTLLEPFICLEAGETFTIQRHQFQPEETSDDLD